jgi:hypothetical protein
MWGHRTEVYFVPGPAPKFYFQTFRKLVHPNGTLTNVLCLFLGIGVGHAHNVLCLFLGLGVGHDLMYSVCF